MLYDEKRWKNPAVKPIEEWRQLLLYAADLIEQKGHCKGAYIRDGAHCALGAIYAVRNAMGANDDIWNTAQDKLRMFLGGSVAQWNDHLDRTHAEVIAALRGAAT